MIKASISVRKVKSLETNDFSEKKVLDAGPGERILIGSLDRQYFLEILEVTGNSVLIKPENLVIYSKEENIKDIGNEIPLNIGQTIILAEAVVKGDEKWEIGLVACMDKNAPSLTPPLNKPLPPPLANPLPLPIINPTPPPFKNPSLNNLNVPTNPPIILTSSLNSPLTSPLKTPLDANPVSSPVNPLPNVPLKQVQNPPFMPIKPLVPDFPKTPPKIEERKFEETKKQEILEIKTKEPTITKTFEVETNISVDNIESLLESDLYQLLEKIVLELQRRLTVKK